MQGNTQKSFWRWVMIWGIVSIALVITLWMLVSFLVPTRPNLILITIDTLRADRLGCYGYAEAHTPNLDALAQQGILCTKVYAQSPLTFPSHATLLTGTSPIFHGIRDNGGYRLKSNIPTLATTLYNAGYQTSAVVSSATLSRNKGLDTGFQTYDDVSNITNNAWDFEHTLLAERTAENSLLLAHKRWQELEATGQPYFLWIHLYDPHAPYSPPSPYREKFADNLYQGEIAYTDDCLGKFLSNLDNKRSLLVITADHGEGLGEHGELSHGYFLYNSTLHIPLIFSGNGIPANQTFDYTIRSMDIMPTILSLLNIREIKELQGEDFSQWICNPNFSKQIPDNSPSLPDKNNELSPPQVAVYAETYYNHHAFGWRVLRSIQYGNYKYHDTRLGGLYDILNDPYEKNNLIAKHPIPVANNPPEQTTMPNQISSSTPTDIDKIMSQFKLRLSAYEQTSKSNSVTNYSNQDMIQLYGLGYVTGQPSQISLEQNQDLPDPTEMIPILDQLRQAQTLMTHQQDGQAISILEMVVQQDRKNILAWMLLGKASTRMKHWTTALLAYNKLNDLQPHWLLPKQALVDVMIEIQNLSGAEQIIQDTMQNGYEDDPILLSRLAYLQLLREQYVQAEISAQKAVWQDNRLPSAWFYLGWALQSQEKYHQAILAFEQALRWGDANWPEAYYRYGQCLARTKSSAQAQLAFETALQQISPEHPLYNSIQQELQLIKD